MLEDFAKVLTLRQHLFCSVVKTSYTCAQLPIGHRLDEGQGLRRGRADVVHSALLKTPYRSALIR